jgi:hypothetical protein
VVDYMAHTNTRRACIIIIKRETQRIFGSYMGFINQLKIIFGEIDKKKHAKRTIQTLRQQELVAIYTTEFQ